MDREPCGSSALGPHVIVTPCSPTKAHSVRRKLDFKHEVQSDAAFSYETDSNATKSSKVYLFECAENDIAVKSRRKALLGTRGTIYPPECGC